MAKKKSEDAGRPEVGPGLLIASVSMKWNRAATDALRPHGISPTQFLFLHGVESLAGTEPVTQSDLARYLHADVMLTSKHVRELESMNLVSRLAHPTDTRARALELTKNGQAMLKRATKAIARVDNDMFGSIGGVEKLRKTLLAVVGW